MSKNKHLDRNDRTIILRGIVERSPALLSPYSGQRQQHHRQGDSSSPSDHPPKKFQIAKNLRRSDRPLRHQGLYPHPRRSCPLHRKNTERQVFRTCVILAFPCRQRTAGLLQRLSRSKEVDLVLMVHPLNL